MYRVFLFIVFLAYCSSVSFRGSPTLEQNDDSDLIDDTGGGYSYFKKQEIAARPLAQPSLDIPIQDLSAYMQGSAFKQQPIQTQMFPINNNQMLNAFGQQQLIPRSNIQVQNLLPRNNQFQQPVLIQKDFPQISSTFFNGFDGQQVNLPIQSRLLAKNIFGNQQDLRTLESQQMRLPQNNFNIQQRAFNGFDNQQQDLSFVQQPQQTWSTQQKSVGFSSSFDDQDEQPVSSSFSIQSNQQNDQKPVTNAVFMSSQIPTQRFISQPRQQIPNSGGW